MSNNLSTSAQPSQKPFEYTSRHGVVFKADRCDFQNGINVKIPSCLDKTAIMADYAEMESFFNDRSSADLLKSFPGWDNVHYLIQYED